MMDNEKYCWSMKEWQNVQWHTVVKTPTVVITQSRSKQNTDIKTKYSVYCKKAY